MTRILERTAKGREAEERRGGEDGNGGYERREDTFGKGEKWGRG
jgi:hypothetical protein